MHTLEERVILHFVHVLRAQSGRVVDIQQLVHDVLRLNGHVHWVSQLLKELRVFLKVHILLDHLDRWLLLQ